jgi:hypothetical protein
VTPEELQLSAIVAKEVHADCKWRAAQYVADYCKLGVQVTQDSKLATYLPIIQTYVHQLMNNGGMPQAAAILWTPTQFSPNPQSVKDVWSLFDVTNNGLIMGAASMGKSFSMGVRLFLEFLRDPEWTGIRVVGPSEDHLEQNLFSHLVGLHKDCMLPMPGEIGDLFIGMDRRNQLASIRGIVIPKGNVKKAGRLQGGKRKPRKIPHPIFGPLSRMFIFIDEIENVPMGIWHDIDNVLSNVTADGGFKILGAYNPTNLGDEVAKRAEPPFGWNAFDEDKHFRWVSTRGWDILRLDGEKSENVIAGKMIYPGLQTREGLEIIAKNAGGTDSAGYATMGRGIYPKQGTQLSVIPGGMLAKWVGEFIWMDDPVPVGSTDIALEGGNNAVYTLGKWGQATGIKYPPSLDFPNGRTVMFKNDKGNITPRWALQAETQFPLPIGETVSMKNSIVGTNKKAGVRPEYYACDRTGPGAGVADLIRYEWSGSIHDVNYSQGASEDKLMVEDSKTCKDQYMYMFSELWFAMRTWGEFSYFLISPKVDMSKLSQQLTQRRFRAGSLTRVESKTDYKSRGFSSPDEADSLTLLVHAARKGSGVILSMKGESSLPDFDDQNDWPQADMMGGSKIDPSNRTDFLDERVESFHGAENLDIM